MRGACSWLRWRKSLAWKRADTSMVFTIAVVVFALTFIVAGRLQDKFGPFWVSLTGGVLVSLGFFLCAFTTSLTYLFICFGVIGGIGQRLRLLHAHSGHGQVVPRQTRSGRRTGGGRIRRRVGAFRPAGQFATSSPIMACVPRSRSWA